MPPKQLRFDWSSPHAWDPIDWMDEGYYADSYRPARGPGRVPAPAATMGGGSPRAAMATRQAGKFGKFVKGTGRAIGGGLKAYGFGGLAIDVMLGGAIITAGGIMGAAQWGAPTGLEEDYVGGAVFGATREMGAVTASTVGALVGAMAGTFIPIPVVGTGIGMAIGGIGGYLIGTAITTGPARNMGMAARAVVQTARTTDRIQFGGSFQDTRESYTMRQRSIEEMSGSMMNARQYLANEAILFHER